MATTMTMLTTLTKIRTMKIKMVTGTMTKTMTRMNDDYKTMTSTMTSATMMTTTMTTTIKTMTMKTKTSTTTMDNLTIIFLISL